MNIRIRNARINNCNSLIDLLNKATLNLHNKGIKQWEYPWKDEDIIYDIKMNYIYIIEDCKNNIIGTFSVKPIREKELFEVNVCDSLYLYRIALAPEIQGRNIGREIFKYIKNNNEFTEKKMYLDCWAGNNKLKSFYSSCGLGYCGDFPEEDYMVSVYYFEDKDCN